MLDDDRERARPHAVVARSTATDGRRGTDGRVDAVATNPDDLHARAGRYADAVAAYEAALAVSERGREQAEVLICWAELCEEQASFDEALALLGRAADDLADADEALRLRIAVRRGWVLVRRPGEVQVVTAPEESRVLRALEAVHQPPPEPAKEGVGGES